MDIEKLETIMRGYYKHRAQIIRDLTTETQSKGRMEKVVRGSSEIVRLLKNTDLSLEEMVLAANMTADSLFTLGVEEIDKLTRRLAALGEH